MFFVEASAKVQIYSVTLSNGFPQSNYPNEFKGRWGGGIYNQGDLVIGCVAVLNNTAKLSAGVGVRGGGIFNEGTLLVYSSTIAGNQALASYAGQGGASWGGGISNSVNGTITILNSTIAGNTASMSGNSFDGVAYGGGVANEGVATIANTTITANMALGLAGSYGVGGGIYIKKALSTQATNTIISGNTATSFGPDVQGPISLFFSLVGGDAKLGPLQNNGGPTSTVSLLPGSPAIDAADNTDAPEWDQRGPGFPRIVNGTIDIGAFEVQSTQAPPPMVPILDPLTAEKLALTNRKVMDPLFDWL